MSATSGFPSTITTCFVNRSLPFLLRGDSLNNQLLVSTFSDIFSSSISTFLSISFCVSVDFHSFLSTVYKSVILFLNTSVLALRSFVSSFVPAPTNPAPCCSPQGSKTRMVIARITLSTKTFDSQNRQLQLRQLPK